MIELPCAIVIKVNYDLNRLNFLDSSCYNIHVVNRTELRILKIFIGGNELNCALSFRRIHGDILVNISIVTHIITSGELDHVLSIGENKVIDGNLAICIITCVLNAVYICLYGRFIKAGKVALSGIFGERGCDGHLVCCDCIAVKKGRIRHTLCCISNIREHRCFSIIYSGRIVNGNIIKIKREIAGNVAVFGCNIFVCRTVSIRDIELHHRTVCLPAYCGIRRRIRIQIVPAGFFKGIYDTRTASSSIHCIGVQVTCPNRIAVFIHSTCEQCPARPKSHALVRNVDPNTNANSIFEYSCFGCIYTGLHITGFERVRVADMRTKRIRSAVNLTASRNGRNKLLTFGPYVIVLCARGFINVYILIGSIFKVVYNLRTLAECDVCYSGKFGVINEGRGKNTVSGRYAICTRDKGKSVNGTNSCFSQTEIKVRCLNDNTLNTIGSINCKRNRLAEGNNKLGACKRNRIGDYNVNGSLTYNFTTINHLNGSSTGLAGRSKHTVGNGTKARICELPGNAFCRDLCISTSLINACCRNCNSRVGSYILIFSGKRCTCKYTIRNCGRNHDKTVRYGSLRAIGRTVYNTEAVRALCFCSISTRSTTIKVTSPNASKIKHNLCLLLNCKTNGLRSLVTVSGHKNNLTICCDTDGLTRIVLSGI